MPRNTLGIFSELKEKSEIRALPINDRFLRAKATKGSRGQIINCLGWTCFKK